jgi:hypothetical protein
MAKKISTGRSRGHIRQRGNSFQVLVYAGLDPLTGKEIRLTGSAGTETEAKALLKRFRARVDEQRAPRTKASFRAAMDAWLRVLDVEESTRESYEQYARVHLYPAFGDEPVSRVTAQLLEAFYAELRRCSRRCSGESVLEHRVDGPHDCRTVKHRRSPGRPPARGYPPHDCAVTGCVVIECRPHECRPLSPATIRRIHFAIRGVLTAAERWGWITSNPATIVRKPRQPIPQPDPTAAQAAPDHRSRMGAGRRLGNAGLARDGNRDAPRRAARAPLVRRRPRACPRSGPGRPGWILTLWCAGTS